MLLLQVGLKYNLPLLSPVDDAGVFTEEAGQFQGLQVGCSAACMLPPLCQMLSLLTHLQNGASVTISFTGPQQLCRLLQALPNRPVMRCSSQGRQQMHVAARHANALATGHLQLIANPHWMHHSSLLYCLPACMHDEPPMNPTL